ncbi:DUF4232 domain-containing protein [Streptomyces sp. NRRL F-5123]|uniref:DUF4232 domain-containing protein n=1 Tax=Streptomyces sp. NRRL F-5123 TaxID=1463856 RepID=UPI000694F629|nr:DUF4232 domain-containing protein [Streptomyces sp. NRRL F-5123]
MTGFPDDLGGAPEGPGPEEPLLRQPPGYLAPPPGSFGQIRRRAARRRRLRTAGGGVAAAAVLAGSVYLVGALTPRGTDDRGSPAATGSPTSPAPRTPRPAPPVTTESRATPGTHGAPPPSVPSAAASSPARDTPTPSGTPTSTGQGSATPMCTASQLTASLGGSDGAAGSVYRYLLLTNRGATACHLTGYPGVSVLDADGRQIGAPADRSPMDYTAVVLGPGEAASDTIRTANHLGTCRPASAKVRVYPPGSRASLVIPGELTVCDELFTITPLAAGRTGNPPA